MNTFELTIWDDESRYCTFYTVRLEENEETETDKFFLRYEDAATEFHDSANVLLSLIYDVIGDKYGAIDDFFDRYEDEAQALPPKPKRRILEIEAIGIHFPLRLYCYRISESIVVLFNGGFKDSRIARESEISFEFRQAQIFAIKIKEALREGMILVSDDKRSLTDFNGNQEIIL